MAIIQTEAIVLKWWKLRETSKIVQFYTREGGRLRVVAKAARRLKSPFRESLEPFSVIQAVYYAKENRDLQLLSKADLIDPHLNIIGNIEKTTLAMAATEIIYRTVVGEESFPELYLLLRNFLHNVDTHNDFLEGYFWYFENRFLGLMGYHPTWDTCLRCGCSLGIQGGVFQPLQGGLFCRRCGSSGMKVSHDTLEILYWLQRASIAEAGGIEPAPAVKMEIRRIFTIYLSSHFDFFNRIRSLEIYYTLCADR